MVHCVVFGCYHTTKKGKNQPPKGVRFHRFPADKALWDLWITKIPRDKWKPEFGKDYRICSAHFTDNDFEADKYQAFGLRSPGKEKKLLKKSAIPSKFPCKSEKSKSYRKTSIAREQRRQHAEVSHLVLRSDVGGAC